MKFVFSRIALAAIVGLATFGLSSTALAALSAYEGFDYAVGSEVVGQNGGTGWNANGWQSRNAAGLGGSSVTVGAPVQSGSLSYNDGTNVLVTSGNSSKMFGTTADSFEPARGLASTAGGADGTSIYMSFLVQRTGTPQDPATTSPPNMYPRGTNVRWWTDGGERGNLGNNSNASTDTIKLTSKSSAILDSGVSFSSQVNFVVARIDFDLTNGNKLYQWVNPNLATEDTGAAMMTPYLDGAATTHGGIDFISPFLGNGSSGRPPSEMLWDELRIGTTYADVTPFTAIPEPATAVLAGLMAAAFAFRRRSVA